MSKNFYIIGTVLLLSIGSSLLFSELVLDAHNTLYLNNNWVVEKRNRKIQVMGSDDFLTGRNSLAKESLQLHQWHGHQKITLKNEIDWDHLHFQLKLTEGSRLSLFLNNEQHEIRLSLNLHYPSAVIDYANNWLIPMDFELIPSKIHVELKQHPQQGLLLILGERVHRLGFHLDKNSPLSFQGGRHEVAIDDIELTYENRSQFKEKFRNTYLEKTYWAIHLLLFLGIALILRFVLKSYYPIILIQIVIFVSITSYSIFDHFYWSTQNYNPLTKNLASDDPLEKVPLFEFLRFHFFKHWTPVDTSYPLDAYAIHKKGYPQEQWYRGPFLCESKNCVKLKKEDLLSKSELIHRRKDSNKAKLVAFLGSSQMVGSGAKNLSHTHFALIYQSLLKEKGDLAPTLLNLSDSSFTGQQLYEKYHSVIATLKPDVIFLNLSFNDTSMSLETSVRPFLDDPQFDGIRFVLIQEPVSKEYSENIRYRVTEDLDHEVLAKLADEYQLKLLPLHRLIKARQDIYPIELWWDIVHLNQAGQQVWAEEVLPTVMELIEN